MKFHIHYCRFYYCDLVIILRYLLDKSTLRIFHRMTSVFSNTLFDFNCLTLRD